MHWWWTAMKLMMIPLLLALPAVALEQYPPAGAGGPTDLRAYVRLVNLAPGLPLADLYLGNTLVQGGLGYGQGTGYQAMLGARSYALAVRPAGAPWTTLPLAAAPLRLSPTYYYTVLALGTPGAMSLLALGDDPGLPRRHQVRVRVVNAVVNGPALTVSTPAGAIFLNVPSRRATNYALLPAGSGPYTVRVAGTNAPVMQIPAPPAHARVYTLVIFGDAAARMPVNSLVLIER